MSPKNTKIYRYWFVISILILLSGKLYPHNQQWHLSGPPGGIITELALISDEQSTIFAANLTPFTGLVKSTDDGETWGVLYQGLNLNLPSPSTCIGALALDLVSPDTMFVTVRTGSYSRIYRSTNRGGSWHVVVEDAPAYAIAAKSGTVYASVSGVGLLASYDGGESWQNITPSLPAAEQIVFDPVNLKTLYVSTFGDGLYRSTDGGFTFEQLGFKGKWIRALDVAGSGSLRLICVSISGDGVYISADNGESWIFRNNGLPPVEPYGPTYSLLISPQDTDVLFAGTVDGVYKSVDQGLNWFPVNEGLGISSIMVIYTPPVLTLAAEANDPEVIYAGTDRWGLFKTDNGGEQWFLMGIPAHRVWSLSVSPLNHRLVHAGTEDGLYVKRGGRWIPTTLWGGETTGVKAVASSPIDTNLVIASFNNAIFTPLIFKSTDGGETWGMKQMLFDGSDVWAIVFDSIFPERVYGVWRWPLGDTGGLIISDDSGDTWDLMELGGARDMAIDPFNSDRLYLLDISGKIQRSDDRGVNWTTIKAETDTEHYAIAIDPFNPENIYLGSNTVWKSLDGGNTWTRTALNQWVLDLAFDENSGLLYAATYGSGVVFTPDGGETWELLGNTPANPYLQSIDVAEDEMYSKIYAGSFGTGVFEWIEEMTPVHPSEDNNKKPESFTLLQNYPNPFNSHTDIRYQIPDVISPIYTTLKIYNILGQELKTLVNEPKEAGNYSVKLDANDMATGIYFYTLKTEEFSRIKMMVLLK